MLQVSEVAIPLRDEEGNLVGRTFRLNCIPRRDGCLPTEITLPEELTGESSAPMARVTEGSEYHFELIGNLPPLVKPSPSELFTLDDSSGLKGRIRTGLHTGIIPIEFTSVDDELLGRATIECIPSKLSYEKQYRWMLRDIADIAAEIIAEKFSPSIQTFAPDDTRDPETLYQQFAFVHSLLAGSEFDAAVAEILRSPHRTWVGETEERPIGKGLGNGLEVLRAVTRSGRRLAWPGSTVPGLASLPVIISRTTNVEDTDNPENRFIKHVFQTWRDLSSRVEALLNSQKSSPARDRGIRESKDVGQKLESLLHEQLFREVGRMEFFPASSQVLFRRPGYREIFHSYLQSETAAQLAWPGGNDVYGAGKKNVATLYELWIFFALAKLVAGLCTVETLNLEKLVRVGDSGFSLTIRRGRRLALSGTTQRFGRKIGLTLFYNKSFSPSLAMDTGSWTRTMRPDYSLRVRAVPTFDDFTDEAWIHFDAKYRIEDIADIAGDEELVGSDEQDEDASDAVTDRADESVYVRDDLLKMHAYKDAVRRTIGAYILYPGSQERTFEEYREILPGLGAFPFSPTAEGDPLGALRVATFIDETLNHLAWQGSDEIRSRFWVSRASEKGNGSELKMSQLPLLPQPPSDSRVGVVVSSNEEFEWIRLNRLVPVSSDRYRDLLKCDLVLLSGPDERLELRAVLDLRDVAEEELKAKGYPSKTVGRIMCLEIEIAGRDTGAIDYTRIGDRGMLPLSEMLERRTESIRPWASAEKDTEWVFAYGSNLDLKQLASRCPASRLNWYKARAVGWRICFPQFSRNRGGGVASIVEDPQRRCLGIAFSVTPNDLSGLDRFEGIPRSYSRRTIQVVDELGNAHEVWTYIGNSETANVVAPTEAYLGIILKSLRSLGYSEQYVQEVISAASP
jgi:hypothetical protein